MKRKQLKKYIYEYRATTKVSPDNALSKRDGMGDHNTGEQHVKVPLSRRLSFWGVAVLALIIIFVLPIALVLELAPLDGTSSSSENGVNIVEPTTNETMSSDNPVPDKDTNPTSKFYGLAENDISYSPIASIQEFKATSGFDATLPSIDYVDIQYREIRFIKTDELIGTSSELGIFSDKYFSLLVFTFVDRYRLNSLSFEDFTDETTKGNMVIQYKYEIDEDYIYSLEFSLDGYLYQVIVTCYDETTIEDILSDCFGL